MAATEKSTFPSVQLVFDTNILVDALLARGPYSPFAVQLLDAVRDARVEGWYAPCCVTSVYYLVERALARETDNRKETVSTAHALVMKFMSILKPLPQVGDELSGLGGKPGDDLEDMLIAKLALDYLPNPVIVTRDKWFLQHGACPAAHPKELVESGLGPWGSGQQAPIPFIDLAAQQRRLRPRIQADIHRVLNHGQYVMGPEIDELERQLADYAGVKHAVACASGTDALIMALMAYGIGPGDAVITTPFTFIATAEAIALTGARPVFVDIDAATFNLDADRLARCIEDWPADAPRLRGIIPVDLFGLPADYAAINAIARQHGLFVIEDAAQSFGGQYRGRMAGSLADIGCTSFFPAKPLGCYGDGGMCFTDDDRWAEVLRSIRAHGQGGDRYDNIRIGINGRLDTLQAVVLLAKFAVFAEEVDKRQTVANRYTALLVDTRLKTPAVPDGYRSAWAQYSLLAESGAQRQAIQAGLKAENIPTAIYYPKPLHQQTAFAPLGGCQGDFPVSEDCARRIFSLPMHAYLASADQERIADALKQALGGTV